jgi:hypothetical protein
MDLKEIRLESVDWVCQTQDRDQCQPFSEHCNTSSGPAADGKFLV